MSEKTSKEDKRENQRVHLRGREIQGGYHN